MAFYDTGIRRLAQCSPKRDSTRPTQLGRRIAPRRAIGIAITAIAARPGASTRRVPFRSRPLRAYALRPMIWQIPQDTFPSKLEVRRHGPAQRHSRRPCPQDPLLGTHARRRDHHLARVPLRRENRRHRCRPPPSPSPARRTRAHRRRVGHHRPRPPCAVLPPNVRRPGPPARRVDGVDRPRQDPHRNPHRAERRAMSPQRDRDRDAFRAGVRRLFKLPLFTRAAARADADAELDAFLAERIDRLVLSGLTPADARAEALRRLGSPEADARLVLRRSAQRRQRHQWLRQAAADLREDLRLAVRRFAHSPAFTATALLTLAFGIGANTAIFSAVHGLLLAPLAFPNGNRIVMPMQENDRYRGDSR